MQETTPTAFKLFDQVIRLLTPVLAAVVGLIIFIYRTKVKELEEAIAKEKAHREKDIKEILDTIKENEENKKVADEKLIETFKEELRRERADRVDMVEKYNRNIEHISDSLLTLNTNVARINQKLDSHIENQEKICKINHNR